MTEDLGGTLEALLAEFDRAGAAHEAFVAEAHRRQDAHEARRLARRREAEARADRFSPTTAGIELGTELRTLRSTLRLPPTLEPDVRTTQGLEAAAVRWAELARDVPRQVNLLVIKAEAWSRSLFRTSRSRPAVPDELLSAVSEMRTLYADAPRLRREFVDAAVAAVDDEQSAMQAELLSERERLRRHLAEIQARMDDLAAVVYRAAPPWGATTAVGAGPSLRLGSMVTELPQASTRLVAPAALDFPLAHGLAVRAPGQDREWANGMLRQLALRALSSQEPGHVRLIAVDAVSLGRSVAEFRHLAEYDERLVDVKTWTSERDVERRLDQLSDHVETVISRYLRGQFTTIDEYNENAGEVTEPYRLLIVFDYPEGFTETAAKRLLSLVDNGARCGVHVLLGFDPDREMPRDVPMDRLLTLMPVLERSGGAARLMRPGGQVVPFQVHTDDPPELTFDGDGRPTSPAAEAMLAAGAGATDASDKPVTLETLLPVVNRLLRVGRSPAVPVLRGDGGIDPADPSTWWRGDTTQDAVAMLGRSGAQNVASMVFSATEIAGGGIMVGLPRSGKSTALHALITTLAMTYGPDELELYLVDSKHGVEFASYANLPHARMVSIHSERELSVSVLEAIRGKIQERAELMKGRGVANITEYRQAGDDVMSRIVLVMDEFHEVFEDDDKLGQQAFAAFSDIVRQGPFAGVHVVVSSQTLSSMPAMDRGTLSLLPMRVAFMCNDADADVVLNDSAKEAQDLNRAGRGLYNPLRGSVGRNQPFQGLLVPREERTRVLADVRLLAAERGWTRQPRVFDGQGTAPRVALPTPGPSACIALGQPYSLEEWSGVIVRNSRGGNVLMVGSLDTSPPLLGALHSALLAVHTTAAEMVVVDLLGLDGDLPLFDLCEKLGASYRRSAGLDQLLTELATDVRNRHAQGRYGEQQRFLFLVGLDRARSLQPGQTGEPVWDEETGELRDASPTPHECLATILRDGAEVGVHAVVLTGSLARFDGLLGRDLLPEFDHRVTDATAGGDDATTLSDAYVPVTVSPGQLLVLDHGAGTRRVLRSYPPLTDLLEALDLVR